MFLGVVVFDDFYRKGENYRIYPSSIMRIRVWDSVESGIHSGDPSLGFIPFWDLRLGSCKNSGVPGRWVRNCSWAL